MLLSQLLAMMSKHYDLTFPFALGGPAASATFRAFPEDFQVTELFFEPFAGSGEHLCLWIEKRGQNTRWVAKLLADAFNLTEQSVGYCGLKDRHAVTRQWFSVHLPGSGQLQRKPELGEGIQVLDCCRHLRKLRRGDHRGNRFRILLRDIAGCRKALTEKLQAVRQSGAPNYFGEQRFGIAGNNLAAADSLLSGGKVKAKRKKTGKRDSLYFSAARAYLFNLVLGARVENHTWQRPLAGETEPQGPLWGRGRNPAAGELGVLEAHVLSAYAGWREGLEYSGLQQQRRDLVLVPEDMGWEYLDNNLRLEFVLPPGSYATSVLRELAVLRPPAAAAVL